YGAGLCLYGLFVIQRHTALREGQCSIPRRDFQYLQPRQLRNPWAQCFYGRRWTNGIAGGNHGQSFERGPDYHDCWDIQANPIRAEVPVLIGGDLSSFIPREAIFGPGRSRLNYGPLQRQPRAGATVVSIASM